MTRKFLEGIDGLSKDAIDKIMAENGVDINAAKKDRDAIAAKLTETESKLTDMQGEITTLKDSNASAEDFKTKFEELQKKIADDETAAKAKAEEDALTAAVQAVFPTDKKFTSDYVKNGITAEMKAEIAKPENKGKGYSEIFAALTTDKQGIFESQHPAGQMSGVNAGADTAAASQAAKAFPTKPWNRTNF